MVLFCELEMTDQQARDYVKTVNLLVEGREKNGTLLSRYDMLATARITLLMAGKKDFIPSNWFFEPIGSDGKTSMGAIDKLRMLHKVLDTCKESLMDIGTTITDMEEEILVVEGRLQEVNREIASYGRGEYATLGLE